jgi:apolipoprotein N-acyltransferase
MAMGSSPNPTTNATKAAAPRKPPRGLLVSCVAASAALFYFGTGLHPHFVLTWFAPLPVLWLAYRQADQPRGPIFVAAFLAYAIGELGMMRYNMMFVPPPTAIFFVIGLSLAFAWAVGFSRRMFRRVGALAAALAFPLAWTSFEFVLARFSSLGTYGSLAYTQLNFLPVLQIASVTGMYGITFLVTLVPAALAAAANLRGRRAEAWRVLALGLLPLVAVVIFGFVRLRANAPGETLTVGLASNDGVGEGLSGVNQPARVAAIYAKAAANLAGRGARAVVLPEKIMRVTPADEPAIDAIFAKAAQENRIYLVVGYDSLGPPRRNLAVTFAPDGAILFRYQKWHLVPGFESAFAPGDSLDSVTIAGADTGVAICRDMDYFNPSRAAARAGARILLVPAWDFDVDAWWHSRMALMRAVENGFALARSARAGMLTAADAAGRIIAETRSGRDSMSEIIGVVPLGPGETTYSRYGNWFGWLAVAGLLVLAAWEIFGGRSRRNAGDES